MSDAILQSFLEHQAVEALNFCEQSDLVKMTPCSDDGSLAQRWLVELSCLGLVQEDEATVIETSGFLVGIWFPDDYLRQVNPAAVVTWLDPGNVWHPNILGAAGAMCLGHIAPGTRLLDLVYRCADIISYHNWASHDALNQKAAQWARNNQHRFPLDTRPLKWRDSR